MQLSYQQSRTLRAICDTLIPEIDQAENSEFWKRKASDLDIDTLLQQIISDQNADEQTEFKFLLNVFNNPIFGLALGFSWACFADLSLEKREKILKKCALSPLADLRKAFAILKKLTCYLFYSYMPNGKNNPNWEAIGYQGAISEAPKKEKKIKPLSLEKDTELSCEIVIVGSGAGGGTVAGILKDKDLIIVEKGNYYNEADFTQAEADMTQKMYDKKGLLSTKDGAITVLAGSTLGGGTVINWAGSFRTPDYILEEWANLHQNPHFLSADFQKCLDKASQAIGVNTEIVQHNSQNQALWDASQKMNHKIGVIPQNMEAPQDGDYRKFGYSPYGCQYGLKKSMTNTHLQAAHDKGARILVNTEIDRVIFENDIAKGVEGIFTNPDGKKYKVKIHAKKVIVAAGAIHTPAILLRSGLQHPHIGEHLGLHPVLPVSAIYQQKINPWWGIMMSAVNDEFNRLDGNFGFKIETPPVHSGLIGMSMTWDSGQKHKENMLKAAHIASFIILTRDKFGGKVSLDRFGKAEINYKISPYDLKHILIGLEKGVQLHLAAGAEMVVFPHNRYTTFKRTTKISVESLIKLKNWGANYATYFSAHQMATCRMGGDSKTHPVAPDGSVYGTKNLYVADASAFPSSSGANPMLTVEALAWWIGEGIR